MNPAGGGVSAWPSADARATRRSRCARTSPAAPCRRRWSAAAPAAKSANWRSGARASATAWSPSGRARSATPRSSPRRRPRRRRLVSASPKAGSSPRRRWSPGCPPKAPTGRSPTASCSTAARWPRRPGSSQAAPGPAWPGRRAPPVQVLATDADGAATLSRPPRCSSTARRRACTIARARGRPVVTVRVRDRYVGRRRAGGARQLRRRPRAPAAARASPTATPAGVYRVIVRVRDRLGNAGVVRRVGERPMRRAARRALASARGRVAACARGAPRGGRVRPDLARLRGPLEGGAAQQAEYAHDPAISGDGQYVAFDGSFGGVTGVWRRDLVRRGRRSNRSPAATPSCRRSARTAATSASRPTKAAASPRSPTGCPTRARSPKRSERVRARHGRPGPAPGTAKLRSRARSRSPPRRAAPPSRSPTRRAPSQAAEHDTARSRAGRSAISADGRRGRVRDDRGLGPRRHRSRPDAAAKGEAPPPERRRCRSPCATCASDTTKLVSGRYDPATGADHRRTGGGRTAPNSSARSTRASARRFGAPPAHGPYGVEPAAGRLDQRRRHDGRVDGRGHRPSRRHAHRRTRRRSTPSRCGGGSPPARKRPTERVTGGSDPLSPACVASGETTLPSQPSPTDPARGRSRTIERTAAERHLAGGARRTSCRG